MIIKALCVIGAKAKNGTGPLYPGCSYDVEDELAKRLVAQDVAEFDQIRANPAPAAAIPSENPPTGGTSPDGPSEGEELIPGVELDEMSFNELKALAKDMGIDTGKIKSKAGMIEAISAHAKVGIPADDDVPPEFDALDVVDE